MANNSYEFDYIANNIFSPIYPVIAKQIIKKAGIIKGNCLDIGSGGGHLGLSIAKQTDMNITLFDKSNDALQIAEDRIKDWHLLDRASTLLGDVHEIPCSNETFQLIVSRGSLWFWSDPLKAFSEIYRLLSPEGFACIGGGFGNETLKAEVYKKMKIFDPEWPDSRNKFTQGHTIEKFTEILTDLQIEDFKITDDDKEGFWITIKKH